MPLIIACDIGGTNARLQLWETAPSIILMSEKRLDPKEFSSLDALLRAFCEHSGVQRVEVACVGIPGPVEDEQRQSGPILPEQNATSWQADARAVEEALGGVVGRVILINDFIAVGLGLTILEEQDYITLREGTAPRAADGVMACIGAGTGLGEVFLTYDSAGYYKAWPSEGGMSDFCAHSEEEWRLRQWLHNQPGGAVTVEAVVSGPGLVNVYRWLLSEAPEGTVPALDLDQLEPSAHPAAIAGAADRSDPLCKTAVLMMLSAYAREARRKACDAMPYGGMFVAGGIAPKLAEHISRIFPIEFVNDPVNKVMLEMFPLYLVTDEELGIKGARVRAMQELAAL